MQICPLLSTARADYEFDRRLCLENECAWWLANHGVEGGGCAMWWLGAAASMTMDEKVNREQPRIRPN